MDLGITAIDGILLGHWTDEQAKTGCTAILCPKGAVAGVDVRGAAPGTRETDLLRGYNLVERVHAVMLSGGSAYGLDAASGAMQYLEERGIGLDVGVGVVPVVPAAVLFDLAVGSASVRPGRQEGYLACAAASREGALSGRIGAGTGATVGKSFGMEYSVPGGLGSSCMELPGGILVGALAAVNAVGDIYDHHTGKLLAAARKDGAMVPCMEHLNELAQILIGTNTTLGVIATNAALTREEANKMAAIAHDGLALSVRPVHTMMDGDTIFALSTGEQRRFSFQSVLAAAAEAMALAVEHACN
ncbi:MAG TPA: P1 family peptidase [Feifaniaceae bacterium]|nr:P1 family peptidase [Feifaniaceae bacterium]